jgi:hypothetical protein
VLDNGDGEASQDAQGLEAAVAVGLATGDELFRSLANDSRLPVAQAQAPEIHAS